MKFCLTILLFLFLSTGFAQTVNDLRPTVTMKEYVDMQAQLHKELTEVQFKNVGDNVTKATAAMEKRLDGMNEFRDTLKDQASTFVTWANLLSLVLGLAGLLFGYSKYVKDKQESGGKSIMSGDKVEVKK